MALRRVAMVAMLVVLQIAKTRALTIDNMPPCGLTCLLITVPASGCSLIDTACQCQSLELARTISACMLDNCTMADSLSTSKVQADICNLPHESKQRELYTYTATAFAITTIFVVLRIIGRFMAKRIAYDDYILITALLLTAVPVSMILKMAEIGFGKHVWDLQSGELLQNLRFFYIAWLVYTVVLALTKVVIMVFYLEIFISKRARIASYVFLGYVAITTTILCFLSTFNCIPIQAFWNRDIKRAKCLDINAIAYTNSVSAILQDIFLLTFPLICIRGLNTNRMRKIAMALMFSIGCFGCIATILRLHTLVSFKTSIDPTWDYVPVTLWTEIELCCCFVCVSLPAVRLFLVRIIPRKIFSIVSGSKTRSNIEAGGRNVEGGGGSQGDSNASPRKGIKSWLHISTFKDESKFTGATDSTLNELSPLDNKITTTTIKGSKDIKLPIQATKRLEKVPLAPDLNKTLPPTPSSTQALECNSCGDEFASLTALPRKYDEESVDANSKRGLRLDVKEYGGSTKNARGSPEWYRLRTPP